MEFDPHLVTQTFAYTNGNYGSGTVYRGEDYRTFVLGFPLECVENTDVRTYLRHIKSEINIEILK